MSARTTMILWYTGILAAMIGILVCLINIL